MVADMIRDVKYVTDNKGKGQEVILSFKLWKEITEELEALQEKHQILTGLKQACRDVKKQERGELPEQPLEEFLDEL
jgi:hypothetical protein